MACTCQKGDLKSKVFNRVSDKKVPSSRKVSVIGAGNVGSAAAYALMCQFVTNDLALIDIKEDKVEGEKLDLLHGARFCDNTSIIAGSDLALSAGSKVIVITSGISLKPDQTRLDLLGENAALMKKLIPPLVEYSPDAIFLVLTNPADVLSYIIWKLSGLPFNRIVGAGTTLDSNRFRALISERLDVGQSEVEGWIIGEHGDNSVPVWSSITVAGTRLDDYNKNMGTDKDPENWAEIHTKVVKLGYEIKALKGCTNWAISLCGANICKAVLNDTQEVFAVSTLVKGAYHCEEDVFLSVPCVIGSCGVVAIVQQMLSKREQTKFNKCVKTIAEATKSIEL